MRALFGWLGRVWTVVRSPATSLSLGFLTLGGFACGLVFWGAFNTALEFANTETFCLSCHEMRSNVYQELSRTVHFSNRSGVRAVCSDCHVPHDWTDKIARKMQASKEVWGHLFGTISTRTVPSSAAALAFAVEKATKMSPELFSPFPPMRPTASAARVATRCS